MLFSQDLLPPLRTAILVFEWRLLGLFFQQPRCEIDVVSGNLADVQYIQNVLAVEEAEQLVCRPVVVYFFSNLGVRLMSLAGTLRMFSTSKMFSP